MVSEHSLSYHRDVSVRTARVKPLPAEQRRASIIEATLPLLRTHGRAVTTRQIAAAAGVAEGTIFRVFPDKATLVTAALSTVFDAEPLRGQLRAVDPDASLRERMTAAVTVLSERVRTVWQLLAALSTGPPVHPAGRRRVIPQNQTMAAVMDELVAFFAPHRDELVFPPAKVACMVRSVVFAGVHPIINAGDPLSTEEMVTLLLTGVQKC